MKRAMFVLALCAGSWMSGVAAEAFEGIGAVEAVNLGQNIVRINSESFYLPSSVTLQDGRPAILHIQPGQLVGFDGDLARPYGRISGIHIYPVSADGVESGLPRPDEQSGRNGHE